MDPSRRYLFSSTRHINVNCPMHLHNTMEIVLVTEGTLQMGIGNKNWVIQAGQGVFVPPFELHCFQSDLENTCYVLEFSGELVRYFFQYCKANRPTVALFSLPAETRAQIEPLLFRANSKADPIMTQALLAPLCYEVYLQCGFVPCDLPPQNAIEKALDYIHAHFDEPITAKQVAQKIGSHPVTISKGFLQRVGLPFNTYLNQLRCSHAAMLLKSSDLTAAEIAFAAGFGSIRNFNRAFLEIYGATPIQYREDPTI